MKCPWLTKISTEAFRQSLGRSRASPVASCSARIHSQALCPVRYARLIEYKLKSTVDLRPCVLLVQLGRFTGLGAYFRMDHGNSLTGTIPSQLGMMMQMSTTFSIGYASYNSFTGSIPSELGQLTAMDWVFRIGSSQLSGSVPSELGQMTALTAWFCLYTNQVPSPRTPYAAQF